MQAVVATHGNKRLKMEDMFPILARLKTAPDSATDQQTLARMAALFGTGTTLLDQ